MSETLQQIIGVTPERLSQSVSAFSEANERTPAPVFGGMEQSGEVKIERRQLQGLTDHIDQLKAQPDYQTGLFEELRARGAHQREDSLGRKYWYSADGRRLRGTKKDPSTFLADLDRLDAGGRALSTKPKTRRVKPPPAPPLESPRTGGASVEPPEKTKTGKVGKALAVGATVGAAIATGVTQVLQGEDPNSSAHPQPQPQPQPKRAATSGRCCDCEDYIDRSGRRCGKRAANSSRFSGKGREENQDFVCTEANVRSVNARRRALIAAGAPKESICAQSGRDQASQGSIQAEANGIKSTLIEGGKEALESTGFTGSAISHAIEGIVSGEGIRHGGLINLAIEAWHPAQIEKRRKEKEEKQSSGSGLESNLAR